MVRPFALLVLLAGCPVNATVRPFAAPYETEEACVPVPVWRDGQHDGSVCRNEARDRGLTVVDLSDDWVPPVLALDTTDDSYAPTYRALAQERFDEAGDDGTLARRDRYLELFGIEPSLSVVRARLADSVRERCHVQIDAAPFAYAPARLGEETAADAKTRSAARRAFVRMVQAHLACDGLFEDRPIDGAYTWQTTAAVEAFQRGEMILPSGVLDAQTRAALKLTYRERAFRTALRVLRARVIAATGVIEDGTAGKGPTPVLDRMLEPEATWRAPGHAPLPDAAPDLVSPATEAAARALGWTDPDATRAFLDALGETSLVAIALPAPPAYHGAAMQLSAEIDRGNRARRPVLVLYAQDGARRIALVRWPTTVGGWQAQKNADGVTRMFKESPSGPRIWRDLYLAPRWLAPDTTPDRELVRTRDDEVVLAREQFGPSYRAAFGLAAFVHLLEEPHGELRDEAIRTHGTGNLASLASGTSHGCHRLLGMYALRLAHFVLAHHAYDEVGDEPVLYRRLVKWHGEFPVELTTFGYHISLTPPIPIEVLREGRKR